MKRVASGGTVALVLAGSLAFAFNLFTAAVLWTAIENQAPLSENATQVLTGWGGGIIGILGAYVGYRVGVAEESRQPAVEPVEPKLAEPL